MITRITVSKGRLFPMVLTYTNIRSYVYTAVFILLDVTVPWFFHQFHLAGPTFLPMHIFVLLAGLLFGWRAGLVVGLFTPLVSHAISGMPVLTILPQIMVELSSYGLVAGILREKFSLRAIWSLIGAMIAGRSLLFLIILILQKIGGEIYSPLGPEVNPLAVLWAAVKQGWPGILIQLVSIPLIVEILERVSQRTQRARIRR